MAWFKTVFVVLVIGRLDTIQTQMSRMDNKCSTAARIPSCETETNIAFGCRRNQNIVIKVKTFNETEVVEIKATEDNCYIFNKVNDWFIGKDYGSYDHSCTYDLLTNDATLPYYIDGSHLSQIKTKCPLFEEVCIMKECCTLTNLSVTTVFRNDIEYKYRNLKITWDKVNRTERINVEIKHNYNASNKTLNCHSPMYVPNHPIDNNTILQPDMVTDREIYPGCTYEISLYETQRRGINCFLTYTVPDLAKQDCDLFEDEPKILGVTYMSDDKFRVNWDPGKMSLNKSSVYKDIYFKYGIESLESAPLVTTDVKQHTAEIIMKLSDEQNYTIVGIFTNNDSCVVETPKHHFIAPSNSTSGKTVAIISLGLFVTVLVILNYKKFLKFIKKPIKFLEQHAEPPQELVRIQAEQIPMNTNDQYTPFANLEEMGDEYEFSRSNIIIKEVIGSGAFGQVYSAKALGIGGIQGYRMVAVKTLGEGENISTEAADDFKAEIEIFKTIGCHSNVVTLLGCCTVDTPYMMIMELVPCGDLKKYLVELREDWLKVKNITMNRQIFFPEDGASIGPPSPISPVSIRSNRLPSTSSTVFPMWDDPMTPLLSNFTLDKALDHTELQNFALQIAKGMAHLEKIGVTHRDLAARNVLINEHKILKISDFGLSRCGPYVNRRIRKLPLRCMAIEAIVEQKYDSRSDVWSFGVVLWEIGTLGAFPYEGVPDSFMQQFLQMGRRLERPEICTNELYSLMSQCWAADPDERPKFQELVAALDVKKRKIYVSFNQLNPTYVFPPSDIEKVGDSPVQIVNINMDSE